MLGLLTPSARLKWAYRALVFPQNQDNDRIHRGLDRDEDEAVAIANDVEYGLHAYVYGPDRERAREEILSSVVERPL